MCQKLLLLMKLTLKLRNSTHFATNYIFFLIIEMLQSLKKGKHMTLKIGMVYRPEQETQCGFLIKYLWLSKRACFDDSIVQPVLSYHLFHIRQPWNMNIVFLRLPNMFAGRDLWFCLMIDADKVSSTLKVQNNVTNE